MPEMRQKAHLEFSLDWQRHTPEILPELSRSPRPLDMMKIRRQYETVGPKVEPNQPAIPRSENPFSVCESVCEKLSKIC